MTDRSGVPVAADPAVAVALVAAVVFLAVAGIGATAAVTDDTAPDLSLSVDATTIGEGDRYGTGEDPELNITASVGDDASAGRELTEVVVRLNGDFYRNFSTDGERFSKSVRLRLETGENTVRVIAIDDRDRATSTTFTAVKDDRRPSVYLTEPYPTNPYRPITDGGVNGSWTTFEATVLDASAIPEVTITQWWNDGNDEYRATTPIRDVGDGFTQRLFLGLGDNRLRLSVDDEYGNTRVYGFNVNVTDAAPPNVTLDSRPTRINQSELVLSGNVTDDVWIDKSRIVVTQVDGDERIEKHVLRSEDYHIDPGRTNTSFEKSIYLFEPGTYRVNVTARDVENKTTTRSFRVERLPDGERPVAPEIRINRDRTVVLDSETLFVDGLAFDGQIRRLVVETRDPGTGGTIGYHRIFSGTNRERVAFDRRVTIQPARTTVIVRAIDANGVEHAERFFVNGATKETFVGDGSARPAPSNRSGPSVSLTPLAGGEAGAASSSVQVTGANAGDRVTVPAGDDADAVVETRDVTVKRVAVGMAASANFTLGVTARDRAAGDLPAPTGARPAGTATIQHSLSADRIDGATVLFHVRRSYLDDHGLDPSNLTVYRRSGGEWSTVETTPLGDNGTHVRYRADSPGFSVFTLASTVPSLSGADADPAGDVTGDNATDGPDVGDELSTNETGNVTGPADGGGNATEGPTATIVVENVTVNATSVPPGAPVAVNATLVNSGGADGEYVAALRVLDPPNITLVDRRTVAVPAGGTRNATFVHRFNETGSYNVSVNGTRAGPVEVGGGGLLSVFSVVPVRLIGLALGALVGVLVVALLVRFVLRRVGGEGTEG